jgi:hypothetical protein
VDNFVSEFARKVNSRHFLIVHDSLMKIWAERKASFKHTDMLVSSNAPMSNATFTAGFP